MNRVLIVDDEQTVLDVTSDMVVKLGFSPMLARTANKALEIVYEQRPGIVLCDLIWVGIWTVLPCAAG